MAHPEAATLEGIESATSSRARYVLDALENGKATFERLTIIRARSGGTDATLATQVSTTEARITDNRLAVQAIDELWDHAAATNVTGSTTSILEALRAMVGVD